jgi:hypothetical protein
MKINLAAPISATALYIRVFRPPRRLFPYIAAALQATKSRVLLITGENSAIAPAAASASITAKTM